MRLRADPYRSQIMGLQSDRSASCAQSGYEVAREGPSLRRQGKPRVAAPQCSEHRGGFQRYFKSVVIPHQAGENPPSEPSFHFFGYLKFEFTRTPWRLMAKLEQGKDVEITTSSSGGRSKHILKLTGRRCGPREAVAQGSARAL